MYRYKKKHMNKKPYLEIYLTTLEAKVIKKSFEKFYADYKNDDEVLNNNPETLKYYLIRNELKPNVVHVLRFLPINAIKTVLSLGFHVGNNNKPDQPTKTNRSLFNQSSTRSKMPRSWFCPIAMVILE